MFGQFRLLYYIPVPSSPFCWLFALWWHCLQGSLPFDRFPVLVWTDELVSLLLWQKQVFESNWGIFCNYRLYITKTLIGWNAKREIDLPESQLCLLMPSSEYTSNSWKQRWFRVLYPREAAGKGWQMPSVQFLWVLDVVFIKIWTTSATYQQELVQPPYPEERACHCPTSVQNHELLDPRQSPSLEVGQWTCNLSLLPTSSASVEHTQGISEEAQAQALSLPSGFYKCFQKVKKEVWERQVQFSCWKHDIDCSQSCLNILYK